MEWNYTVCVHEIDELLNPSEAFGDIMIDYSYPECSSACLQALLLTATAARKEDTAQAKSLARRCSSAALRALQFLLDKQHKDGSWCGAWAVCFTYATWFGCAGVAAAVVELSQSANVRSRRVRSLIARCDTSLHQAASFILSIERQGSKQEEEEEEEEEGSERVFSGGGWGEDVDSCARREHIGIGANESAQVVQTAWAMLALISVLKGMNAADAGARRIRSGIPGVGSGRLEPSHRELRKRIAAALRRGARALVSLQQSDGDFPQQRVTGIFNQTVAICYPNYRNAFPTWALAEYALICGEKNFP